MIICYVGKSGSEYIERFKRAETDGTLFWINGREVYRDAYDDIKHLLRENEGLEVLGELA